MARRSPRAAREFPYLDLNFRPRLLCLEDRTMPAAGALDPTFGTGGMVDFNFTLTDNSNASVLQSDGKIVVGGATWSGSPSGGYTDFALARFLANGTPDSSFGIGGKVQTTISQQSDGISALSIQSDGKIIAAGTAQVVGVQTEFALARYNSDGSLDTTFGTNGWETTGFGTGASAAAVAVQPDGKIIVAGNETVAQGSDLSYLALVRYNSNGSLDTTFGTGGIVGTNVSVGGASISRIALQADGKIVVGGSTDQNSTSSTFVLARYLSSGALDTSFGSAGIAKTQFPADDDESIRGLAIEPDGRIVAGGVVLNSSQNADLALARYLPNGTLDPLFGQNGFVTVDLGNNDSIDAISLQPDGRIVAGGTHGNPGGSYAHVTRFNSDGSLDATFGTNGTVLTKFNSDANDDYNSILIQPNGSIVATGTTNTGTNSDFALARYLAGGSVIVSPRTDLTTSEAGASAQFSVVLSQAPTANVTVPLGLTAVGEGSLSTSALTFTSDNWSVPQTVTVTGVDDPYDDGDITYPIHVGAAASTDANFNNVRGADVIVTNTNDDFAGITVTPTSGLVTTETPGPPAQFTVVLTCEPEANVTIGLSSSSPSNGAPTVSSLTFTPSNWSTPQTVYVAGADDQVVDGNVYFNVVTAPAVSTDPAYNGLNAADVQVQNIDNDVAGITVTPTSGLITTEAGGTAQFTVALLSIPTATVTISLTSSDTTEGTVSPATLTFQANSTALNAHTVTITGVNDTIIDGNIQYTIITGAASSSDPVYSGMAVPDVSVTNLDDDVAGFVITPTSGLTTSENGTTAQFTVRLTATPSAYVTLPLSSSNLAEGTVSPGTLTFTPANWLTPQTVTITGVNDGIVDGNVLYAILTGPSTSNDANFNGLDPVDVSVTNLDNDPIRISSIVVNNGTTQRSTLNALRITFSQVVNVGANAIAVQRTDGYTPGLITTTSVSNAQTIVNVGFTGTGVVNGTLPDGRYTLTITAAGVTDSFGQQLDGDGNGLPGGDYVSPTDTLGGGPGQLRFFRLYGDATGDGVVDSQDLGAFRTAFNSQVGQSPYQYFLDADNNGVIDARDLGQFRANYNSMVFPLTPVVASPPTVANVQVNDGSAQRSEVRSITVTFSGDVAFANGNAAAAFQLLQVQTGNDVILAAAPSLNAAGDTVVTLTFSGSETDPVSALSGGMPSLADGRYQLTILGSAVSDAALGWALDGDGDGNPGGNYVSPTDTLGGSGLHLYRLFGDTTGNGVVDAQDLGALRSAFNTTSGSAFYLSYLDADNSGSIDALDLGQFRSRYNASVF